MIFQIPKRRLFVLITFLVWSSLGFCAEIHDAARIGDLARVKALLQGNRDLVFSQDPNPGGYNSDNHLGGDWTPLHVAAAYGRKEVAELLLANKADVNAKDKAGWSPLHWASCEGHKDVVELLLTKGANVNATNELGVTPLSYTASMDHKDVAGL